MKFIQDQKEYVKNKPIAVGVSAVLATLSLGMALSFALGFANPLQAFAQVVGPCPCGVIIPPPIIDTPAPPVVDTSSAPSAPTETTTTPPPVTPPPVVTPPVVTTTVPVSIPPPSCTLVVSSNSITSGGSVTLTWTSQDANTATINGSSVATSGTETVSPTTNTTYDFKVVGGGGFFDCTKTVTVTPPPTPSAPTCTLSASPTSVATGDASALTWSTTNATSFSIDNGIGSKTPVSGGSVSTGALTTDTTFTGTATGPGGTVHCTTIVTVTSTPPPPASPTCALSANPNSVTSGGTSTLTWQTANAVSFVIDQGIGTKAIGSGSAATGAITATTTFTGLATASNGATATCTARVVVTPPPPPNSPTCTLSANPAQVNSGGTSTLTWTTTNANSFSINHSIGPVSLNGSTTTPAITSNTTFTGTATASNGKSVTCAATVTIPPPPNAPTCTLSANPTSTAIGGGSSVLAWTTSNAASFSIDQNIGNVTPLATGSTTVKVSNTTTYTGTVTGTGGQVATCTATVTVPPPGGGGNPPACTLSASPTSVSSGATSTLTWTSTNATAFSIDQNIGSVNLNDSTSTQAITGNTTFTGTATGPNGTVQCTATVTIPPPNPGCTRGCGGGGGGGGGNPVHVTLSQASNQPLSFVYLSQIPYTGLDLGPIGTFLYWLLLALWSAALAYLAIFKLVPFVVKRMSGFGHAVAEALNAETAREETHYAYNAPAQAPAYPTYAPRPQSVPAPMPAPAPLNYAAAPEASSSYSAYQGFRSFGRDGALTIDDIVKGLSRQPIAHTAAPVQHAEPANSYVEPTQDNAEPTEEAASFAAKAAAPKQAAPLALPAAEVPQFISLILDGNREDSFAMIRSVVREGGDAESFLTQVAVALDDAYRARLDGTKVHAEIARVTDQCATPFLEKLVTSLSTGVDSTYSQGITGAKLAVARALAVVEG